jgi:hypothetical protein
MTSTSPLWLDQQGQVMHHGPRACKCGSWKMALAVQRIIDRDGSLIYANDHQGVSTWYPIDRSVLTNTMGESP